MFDFKRLEAGPVIIIVFFLVVFMANGVLIWLAGSSWNGLVTKGHYEKGITYADTIAARDLQEALGWRVALDTRALAAGKSGQAAVRVFEAGGQSLPKAAVTLFFFRPVKEGHDVTQALTETGPGVYEGEIRLPLPGWWDVTVLVERDSNRFRQVKRIRID